MGTVTRRLRAVLDRDLTDVTLVAHSWGGYPATAAAHQLTDRLSKVIFYSALVPARGVPLAEENPPYSRMIHDDIAATPDGTTAITITTPMPSTCPTSSPSTSAWPTRSARGTTSSPVPALSSPPGSA